jgi:hypothetical protein
VARSMPQLGLLFMFIAPPMVVVRQQHPSRFVSRFRWPLRRCSHSMTKTAGIFGVESFLRDHAAILAAYLNGLPKRSSGSVGAQRAQRSGQANSSKPSSGRINDEKSPVSRALNGAADTVERTLNKLLAR